MSQEMLPTVELSYAVCKFCGGIILAKSKRAVFCSDACRLRWYRFKHASILAKERALKAISDLEFFAQHPDTASSAQACLWEIQERLNALFTEKAASDLDWLK